MDIYIYELDGGEAFAFCMLPESIKVKSGVVFENYDVVGAGEVSIPGGTKLDAISWNGTLPGAARKNSCFIRKQFWMDPKTAEAIWQRWRDNGAKLQLLVTETSINMNVYLSSYTCEPTGGCGDVEYDIAFVAARDLRVYALGEEGTGTSGGGGTARPAPAAKKTHTVVVGESLWSIAQSELGNGSRYPEIYALNKELMDKANKRHGTSKYTVYGGQVLTLPER